MSNQEYPFGIDRRRGDRRKGDERRSGERRNYNSQNNYDNLRYHTCCINKIINDISNDIHQINKNMRDGQ
jgi:hypothetical protein